MTTAALERITEMRLPIPRRLSFYKEELSGETANYVHIRATTDESSPVDTLRLLADETIACQEKIGLLIGGDHELMAVWRSFEQVRRHATRYKIYAYEGYSRVTWPFT